MTYRFKKPPRIELGHSISSSLNELILNMRDYEKDKDYLNPCGYRTVCGYSIPDWQRPLVWTEEQQISLIESLWRGIPIGSYSINHYNVEDDRLKNIVIDGQQRLYTIERYFTDQLIVFGARWCDVDPIDQRFFKNNRFEKYEVKSSDRTFLTTYYNHMNFSGVKHNLNQKA